MDFSEKDKRYKDSLLYKVAWLYYIDGLTQKEIADPLWELDMVKQWARF